MATVPKYDEFQVSLNGGQSARFQSFNNPSNPGQSLMDLSGVMSKTASAIDSVISEEKKKNDSIRVTEAMNNLSMVSTRHELDALRLQGKNALDRPDGKSLTDEYDEKISADIEKISEGLTNEDQKLQFSMMASKRRTQLYESISRHSIKQQEQYSNEVHAATIETAINQGSLLWGDKARRDESVRVIKATVKELASSNGWDDVTAKNHETKSLSVLHKGIVKSMIQGGYSGNAKSYYNDNKEDMTQQDRLTIKGLLKESSEQSSGISVATEAWNRYAPKDQNDAVRLFDMEAVIRNKLSSNPGALSKAITNIRGMASAFNAQQAEYKAKNTSDVWKMIDDGLQIEQVKMSDSWMNLPADERHRIEKAHLSDLSDRSNKIDNLLEIQNADKFYVASDPAVLSKMSRAQVESLRTTFGRRATEELLSKHEKLQSPASLKAATIDNDDFNFYADQMGMKPYAKSKSEDDKKNLGMLKYRVETIIDDAQNNLNRSLTRDEKRDIMKKEISRTVATDAGIFSFEKQVPVITITPDKIDDVVVPAGDRKQIVEAMKAMNAKSPNDPRYFPTERNVRMIYLQANGATKDLLQ